MAAIGVVSAAVGAAHAWLLSHLVPFAYDWAEFENGLRNGAVIGASLVALDRFHIQEHRGAWVRRAGFAFGIIDRATLYALLITAILALNRLIFGLLHGFERSGLDYFGLPLLRDILFSFFVFLVISFVLQMRRVIGGRTLTNLMLGRYSRPVREERLWSTSRARPGWPSGWVMSARMPSSRARSSTSISRSRSTAARSTAMSATA